MDEPKYVLVVDDDETVRFILDQALQALGDGYRIETAGSGEEALEKARGRSYDVLVTDMVMDGMNGVQLTDEIEELYPDIEVVWITAHGCHKFRSDMERLHVHQCLEKPVRMAEIRQAVVDAAEEVES